MVQRRLLLPFGHESVDGRERLLLLFRGHPHGALQDLLDVRHELAEGDALLFSHRLWVPDADVELPVQVRDQLEHLHGVVQVGGVVLIENGARLRRLDLEDYAVEPVTLVPLQVGDLVGLLL